MSFYLMWASLNNIVSINSNRLLCPRLCIIYKHLFKTQINYNHNYNSYNNYTHYNNFNNYNYYNNTIDTEAIWGAQLLRKNPNFRQPIFLLKNSETLLCIYYSIINLSYFEALLSFQLGQTSERKISIISYMVVCVVL